MPDAGAGHGRPLTAPFRPRAARIVSWALLAAVVAATLALVIGAPIWLGADRFTLVDQTGTVLLGAAICWVIYRQLSVSIVPDDEGLTVRNLIHTTRLTWPQVVAVRFGPDNPWARLDLADGSELAAMGIQSADGDFARAEARRLATLVALHEPPEND